MVIKKTLHIHVHCSIFCIMIYFLRNDSVSISLKLHYRMPILYNNISSGHFLCALFFICISLAGFSSMVSLMERTIRVCIDFGSMCNSTRQLCYFVNVVRRIPATIIVGLVTFFIGLGSALDIDILINQVASCIL